MFLTPEEIEAEENLRKKRKKQREANQRFYAKKKAEENIKIKKSNDPAA